MSLSLHSTAPSWSWASVNFAVRFIDISNAYGKMDYIARVKDVHTTSEGPNRLGKVLHGYLCISGHLRKASRQTSTWFTRVFPTHTCNYPHIQYEWFDAGYIDNNTRHMRDAYFFLMAYRKLEPRKRNSVIGLVLEPYNKEKTLWRRIGAFQHLWNGVPDEYDAPLTDYPEFNNWDPNNFERHTVTII
jgi:hypothetical protein